MVTVKVIPIITGTNGNNLFNCKCSVHKAVMHMMCVRDKA
jgi:hypothetical protein